jgi:AraC family transcriptional regulator
MRPDTRIDYVERIARVVAQLRTEPELTLSLSEIADIAALSPFHAIRVFRLITGYTPAAMQTALRVQEAKRLMAFERATVTEACFAVGFSSLGSFSQRFATLCGVNPSEFRAQASRVEEFVDDLTSLARNPNLEPFERNFVSGSVIGHQDGPALFFVGLYPPGPPMGRPLYGDVLTDPGEFVIRHVPDGTYQIYCAVIAQPDRLSDWSLPDSEVQTGGGQIVQMMLGEPVRDVQIDLQPRTMILTPIMTALMAMPCVAEIARLNQQVDAGSIGSRQLA